MLKTGTVIRNNNDSYTVEKEIGSGGMATIYRGTDQNGRVCCIKEAKSDKDSIESLQDEAMILVRMNHWGVPKFYKAFEWQGHFLIIMEFIQGETLADLIERKGVADEAEVAEWGIQICEILNYLHSRNPAIIHRDIKPANIILRPNGKIALIDFGIAREFKVGKLQDTRGLGTKGYAAPEQYGGMGQTDARTDIYSFGATMFYLLSGKNPMDVLQEFPMVTKINPRVSDKAEDLIEKATRTRPDQRYRNAAELAAAMGTLRKSGSAGIGTMVMSIALAVIGIALVIYEALSGIPHIPVFLIGGVLIMAAVSLFFLKGGYQKSAKPVSTGSKARVAFFQNRDDFGSGNISGISSGRFHTGDNQGVIVEDNIWFLATDDWISVIGKD